MNGLVRLILLTGFVVVAGCGSTKHERRADRGVTQYFAGDYSSASRSLQKVAKRTDENFVLNNLRLGSACLMRYDLPGAEAAFLNAYEVINSVGVNDGGRSLGAVLVNEKIKIWKGEPYERAMANFYLGLVYYMQQDWGNARGAFENALFKLRDYSDKSSDKNDFRELESNFAVAAVMLGKCWQKLGREDLAQENFRRAVQARPELREVADYDRNRESNLLLVIEYGRSPQKVTDFDGSIVGFEPTPQQARRLPRPEIRINGETVPDSGIGEPTVDLVAMAADRRWQDIDTIRAVKSGIGTGLIVAGAGYGAYKADRDKLRGEDVGIIAGLIGTGLLLKATSQADTRQWEMLPRTVYVMPLRLPPGTHNIDINFPDTATHQSWRGLVVPERGEATYLMRMSRSLPGPFYWPPDALLSAQSVVDLSDVEPGSPSREPRKR